MTAPQALESSFLLDPDKTEREKRLRERHFHVIEVPRLRILGLVILTLLVIFHEVFSTGETNWRLPITIGAVLLVYSLASWAVLYLFFEKIRQVNLGTLFLALDIPGVRLGDLPDRRRHELAVLPALHPRRRSDQHELQARARRSATSRSPATRC